MEQVKRSGTNFVIETRKIQLKRNCKCQSLSSYNNNHSHTSEELIDYPLDELARLLQCDECQALWVVQDMTEVIPFIPVENRAETTLWNKITKLLKKDRLALTYWDVYEQIQKTRPKEVSGFGTRTVQFVCNQLGLPIPAAWEYEIQLLKEKDAVRIARNLNKKRNFVVVTTDQELLQIVKEYDTLKLVSDNSIVKFIGSQIVERQRDRLRSNYD
jgi:hypothetical protein